MDTEYKYFHALVGNDALAAFIGLPGSQIETMKLTPLENGVFAVSVVGALVKPEAESVESESESVE